MARFKGRINSVTDSEIVVRLQDDGSSSFAEAVLSRRFRGAQLHEAELIEVIDGDTIRVNFNGTEERVRFIGVLAPEISATPNEDTVWGEKASAYLSSLLQDSQYVYLEFDNDQRDVFDRLLAYVYLDRDKRLDRMLNAIMIKEGFASSSSQAPNNNYVELLNRLEVEARKAPKGMWAEKQTAALISMIPFGDFDIPIDRYKWNEVFRFDRKSNEVFYLGLHIAVRPGDHVDVEGDFNDVRAIPNISLDTSAQSLHEQSLKSLATGEIPEDREHKVLSASSNIKIATITNDTAPPYPEIYEMRLGCSKFIIPPLSIDVQRRATVNKSGSLRSKSSIKTGTGHSDIIVMMNLYFHDIDSINDPENGLRALLAQFKRTPFLPVDNYYLNIVHDIWNVSLLNMSISTDPEFPDCLNVQLTLMNFNHTPYIPSAMCLRQVINYDMFKWYFQKDLIYEYNPETMMPYPDRRPGRLKPLSTGMRTGDFEFFVVPEDELERAREIHNRGVTEEFENLVDAYKKKADDLLGDEDLLKRIDMIIEEYNSSSRMTAQDKLREIRTFVYSIRRQNHPTNTHWILPTNIVLKDGVIHINSLRLRSESLRKKLGIEGPFSIALVENDETLTMLRKELGTMLLETTNALAVARAKESEAFRGVREYDFNLESYRIDDRDQIILTNIHCSHENILAPIQLAQLDSPTHQYLGSHDVYVKLDFECTSELAVASLRELMDYTQMIARDYRSVVKSGFLRFKNDLVNMLGVEHILIEDINVSTVPEQPGLYIVQMVIVNFDIVQSKLERNGSIVGRLDGSGRFVYSGEEHDSFGDEETRRGALDQQGSIESVARGYHIEKFMGQFELYPDLELPTYEQLAIAYKHAKSEEFKDEYGYFDDLSPVDKYAIYADPDFYCARSTSKSEGIVEVTSNPEDAQLSVTDVARGEVHIRPPILGEDPKNSGWWLSKDQSRRENIVQSFEIRKEEEEKVWHREEDDEAITVTTAPAIGINPDQLVAEYSNISTGSIQREIINAVEENNAREVERASRQHDSPVIIQHQMALWLASHLSGYKQFELNEDERLVPYTAEGLENRYGVFQISSESFPNIVYINDEPITITKEHIIYDYRINIRAGIELMRRAFLDATGAGNNNLEEQREFAKKIFDAADQLIGETRAEIDDIDRIIDQLQEERAKSFIESPITRFVTTNTPSLTEEEKRRIELLEEIEELQREKSLLQGKIRDFQAVANEASDVITYGIRVIDGGSVGRRIDLTDSAVARMIWTHVIKNHFLLPDIDEDEIWLQFETMDAVAQRERQNSSGGSYGPSAYNINELVFSIDKFDDSAIENFVNRVINVDPSDPLGHYIANRPILDRVRTGMAIREVSDQIVEKIQLPDAGEGPRNESAEEAMANMLDDQKQFDMSGRLVRAFPTFHMFIIEEGRILKRWKLWDNFYGFSAISSIEIVRSRKIAADTAVITLSNIYGSIVNESINPDYEHDDINLSFIKWVSNFTGFASLADEHLEKQDFIKSNLFLRHGSRIHLRMGYGSDARKLPVVFNGSVTEYQVGDTVEIIAQGDGLELANKMPFGPNATTGSFGFGGEPRNILVSLMTKQGAWKDALKKITGGTFGWGNSIHGVEHFGDLWFDGPSGMKAGEIGQNIHPGIDSHSTLYAEDIGEGPIKEDFSLNPFKWFNVAGDEKNLSIDLYDKTIWDVAQICAMAIPNYITAVHPFGFRSTLFYGKPHHGLCYDYEIITKEEYSSLSPGEHRGYVYIPREGLWFREKRKPFQQWHVIDSLSEIIDNKIKASSDGVYNNVIGRYHAEPASLFGNLITRSRPTEEMVIAHADRDILPRYQKTITVDTHIKCKGNWLLGMFPVFGWVWGRYHNFVATKSAAIAVAQSAVRDYMKDMYKGAITIIGNPALKPYDAFYLWDYYNEMYGIAEIEQVVHHMSADAGFITTITPDAAVAVADPERHRLWAWMGSVALGGISRFVYQNMLARVGGTHAVLGFVSNSITRSMTLSSVGITNIGRFAGGVLSNITASGFNLGTVATNIASKATGGLARAVVGVTNLFGRLSGIATAATGASAITTAGLSLLATAAFMVIANSVEIMLRRYLDLSQCIVMSPLSYKRYPFTAAMEGSQGVIVGTVNNLSSAKFIDNMIKATIGGYEQTLNGDGIATTAMTEEYIADGIYNMFFAHTKTKDELEQIYRDKITEDLRRMLEDEEAGYIDE